MSRATTTRMERTAGRRRSATAAFVTTLCIAALGLIAVSHDASAAVRSFRATQVRHGVATFKLRALGPSRIRSGHLSGPRRRSIAVRRLRAAARRGLLRVRVTRRGGRRWGAQRVRRLKLVVVVRRKHRRSRKHLAFQLCSGHDFRAGNWPPACWRPYSNESPFNSLIPDNPRLHPDSNAIVKRLSSDYRIGQLQAGTARQSNDHGHPIYYASANDPLVRVDCRQYCSGVSDGQRLRIPAGAEPAFGVDHHMDVIEPDGTEWTLWHAQAPRGGTIVVGEAKKTPGGISGLGIGGGVDAAHFGLAAGMIRAQELRAGRINHALVGDAPCATGRNVWPSEGAGGSTCDEDGTSNTNALTMGMRLQLDPSYMTNARLATYPRWKQIVLRAYRDYGLYVEDTCGCDTWGAPFSESGTQYVSLGFPDKFEAWARDVHNAGQRDVDSYDGDYVFHLEENVNWSHLRIIDPCVTHRSC
jgi:hypothetical protein